MVITLYILCIFFCFINCIFFSNLSLDELCASPQLTPKYDLYAVINKISEDNIHCEFKFGTFIHFILQIYTLCFFVIFDVIIDAAYIKNSGKWYSCDDSKCSELSASKVVVSLNFIIFCNLFTLI